MGKEGICLCLPGVGENGCKGAAIHKLHNYPKFVVYHITGEHFNNVGMRKCAHEHRLKMLKKVDEKDRKVVETEKSLNSTHSMTVIKFNYQPSNGALS